MNGYVGYTQRTLLIGLRIGGLLAICALIACSPAIPDRVDPGDKKSAITFIAFSPDRGHYEMLAQVFNAEHPAIQVQVRDANDLFSPGDDLSSVNAIHLLASSADVFLAGELDPATLSASGAVYDLRLLLDRHREFAAGDLFSGLLERYQSDGGLWAIPAGVSPRLLFYNKTIFDAAQVDYPQPGWAWEDFVATALALTDRKAGVWGFAEQWRYDNVDTFVYQHGGKFADGTGPAFSDPLAIEALDWYADLARTHGVMPGPDSSDAPQQRGNSLALTGRAAMWVASLRQNRSTDTGIAPLPRDAQDAAMATVPAYYVSAGAAHHEAAWQWIAFLTRQSPEFGLLPARRSVLASPAYRSKVDDEDYATYRYILEHLSKSPWPGCYPWFATAYDWLADEGLPTLMRGESDAQTILAEAQSRALAALAETPRGEHAGPVVVEQPTPTLPDTVNLTFLRGATVGDAYEKLARVYQQEHPDVTVKVIEFRSCVDYPPEERAATADVFPAPSIFELDAVKEHWLDLQPLLESDPSVTLDDFYPQALDAYRRQGDLWGLPVEMNAQMLFYNKALFDRASVPYPQPGWTWDDFLTAADRLTQGEGAEKQWGFVTTTNGWATLPLILAAQQGGSLVNSRAAPTVPTLNAPAVVEAVRWYANLSRTHGVMPSPPVRFTDWERMCALVSTERAAMWISSVEIGMLDPTESDLNLGVVPLPVSGQAATTYGIFGYGISAQTPYPQESWRWLDFLTRQPGAMRGLPARRSLADQATFPIFPADLQPEIRQTYQLTLDGYADAGYDAVRSQAPWFDAVYRAYRQALKQTLEDGADPAESLGAAQAIAEAYMACLGTNGELGDPAIGGACEEETGIPAPVVWYEE